MLIVRGFARRPRRHAASSRLLGAALLLGCGGVGASATGPDANSAACNKGTLTVGGSVTGNTGGNQCRLGTETGNLFTLVVTQSSAVTLTVSGNAFPGFIGLYTSDGKYLAARNDKDPSLTIPIVLGPGTYLLRIDTMTGADGPYTLSAPTLATTGCVADPGILMTKGATFSGTLSLSSCSVPDGRRYQAFLFVAGVASTFSVAVTADKRAFVFGRDVDAGTWTQSLSTTAQGNINGTATTLLNQAGVSLPLTYTVKAD